MSEPDEPTPAGAPPAPEPVYERPHPLSPLVKGWIALVALLFGVGRDQLEHLGRHQGDPGGSWWWLAGLLGAYVAITAVFGYFGWRFTRFVIDDHQVRVEHNFVQHRSDQVPFTKIQSVDVVQPFAARLIGLAQLRIDVGSGRPQTIEYLGRERAYQLRDYLVTRAHGRTVALAEHAASTPVAGALDDRAAHEQVLLTVPSKRLVVAGLLSVNVWLQVLLAAVVVAVGLWADAPSAWAVVLPIGITIVSTLGHDVMQQWHFRLLRSGQALKVSRGMTSLTSQTLPTHRIQGLAITQHLTWRPLGLYRVQMDVLGYGRGDSEKADATSNVLLPAGTWPEVLVAVAAVWPDFRFEQLDMQPSPRRARWLHPLAWPRMAWGSTEEVFCARSGWLVLRTNLVHHARVQSVHLRQGPLQRWLHLADAHLDTTSGPVDAVAHELDDQVARALVLAEMDRCRTSRRLDARRRALDALPLPVVGASPETGSAV